MTDDELIAKVEEVFADILSAQDVPPRLATKLNSPGWDSFAQLALVTALEQEFEITISDDDAIGINSFDAALIVVREQVP